MLFKVGPGCTLWDLGGVGSVAPILQYFREAAPKSLSEASRKLHSPEPSSIHNNYFTCEWTVQEIPVAGVVAEEVVVAAVESK